jgi:hypothetical protein
VVVEGGGPLIWSCATYATSSNAASFTELPANCGAHVEEKKTDIHLLIIHILNQMT